MSVKEIDNANTTRSNAYTIHTTKIHTNKYIEHLNQQQAWYKKKKKRDRQASECNDTHT